MVAKRKSGLGAFVLVLKSYCFHHVEVNTGKEKLAAYFSCFKLSRSSERPPKDQVVIED